MDRHSARALVCAGLGPIGDVVVNQYVADVRERSTTRLFIMLPTSRCQDVGKYGRCRKKISKAAVVQRCAYHQCDVYRREPTDWKIERAHSERGSVSFFCVRFQSQLQGTIPQMADPVQRALSIALCVLTKA